MHAVCWPVVTLLCRNPVFFPSDRNMFFLFVNQSSSPAYVTISFWDHDVGGREEIGQIHLSYDMLLVSGDRCPSDIISLPIVLKSKASLPRGCVDLRYGLVSLAPPLPAAELLSRHQPSPFSIYLQRRIRFLQVRESFLTSRSSFVICAAISPSPPPPHSPTPPSHFFFRNTTLHL